MKATVTTHKLTGYRSTLRTSQRLADQAVRLVNRAVPGRMPDVTITLTDGRGMADLSLAAFVDVAGGQVDTRTQTRTRRELRRTAGAVFGCAIPMPDGSVLILVNVEKHPTPDEFARTLVHELVHAVQFSRHGVRERITRQTRDGMRVERQTRRQARDYIRHLRDDENEAHGLEYLAEQLVPHGIAA